MVTLSCLIVEAGLYSQINSNMPASASPKAVDIFFFYNIARLFWVCLQHTINYRWLVFLANKKNENTSKNAANDTTLGSNKIIIPQPPIYYAPNEKQMAMNAWTSKLSLSKQGNSGDKMKTFKKFNLLVFIIYIFVDFIFFGLFVLNIIMTRNNISEDFDIA